MRIFVLLVLCTMPFTLPPFRLAPTAQLVFRRLSKLACFFGEDGRVKITATSDWPWLAIGQLETASGNLCTATLISSHLALTADHCVLTPPGQLDKAIALRFITDNNHWKYQTENIETLVDSKLGKKLKPDGNS